MLYMDVNICRSVVVQCFLKVGFIMQVLLEMHDTYPFSSFWIVASSAIALAHCYIFEMHK